MRKHYWLLVLFISLSASLHAKPLLLENQYQIFEGEKASLQAVIGAKPVYLKFWATWCLECRHELPSLEQAYQKHRDQIAMFAVNLNINETDTAIKKLQQKHRLTIPVLMDNNGTIASNFVFKGTPFHVLINRKGEVVYTTYKDDAQLAQQLALLAKDSAAASQVIDINTAAQSSSKPLPSGISLVYFSATWCDWYMKDIHPEISNNCIYAQRAVDKLYRSTPGLQLSAYVTHLWTEAKDVEEYSKKFSLPYKVTMDDNNNEFRRFKASGYPTLIVFKNGMETARFTEFDQGENTFNALKRALEKH
ncbi:TlpA family protein disulfide reductase [Cellvibrio sp. UBA7661]|uniref:TlpA family protein disulfide reductase n=1 Tax=Cellvibrio sp. UBA7661 TaxID=1946311 RepID=UPI002F360F36